MFESLTDNAPALRPKASEISPGDWRILSRYWYPVAVAGDVKQQPLRGKLLDVELVIYRVSDRIAVAWDICPHRGVRLSAGSIINNTLVCAFHGLAFDEAGQCVAIPAAGVGVKPPARYRLRSFRCEVKYGLVWACLDEQSTEQIPPLFERALQVGVDRLAYGTPSDWPVAAPHQIENYLDIAHLPWVHQKTLGGDRLGAIAIPKVTAIPGGILVEAQFDHRFEGGDRSMIYYRNTVQLPFSVYTDASSSKDHADVAYQMWNIAAPTSAHACRVFWIFVADQPVTTRESQPPLYNGTQIGNEDLGLLSQMAGADYPLDERRLIHVPVDNISNEYRKSLRNLGLGKG